MPKPKASRALQPRGEEGNTGLHDRDGEPARVRARELLVDGQDLGSSAFPGDPKQAFPGQFRPFRERADRAESH